MFTATPRNRMGLTLALLALAQLITSLDYNIVYVALPDIGRGLGFSAQTLQWVVSAYAVAFGGFLLLGGRASDLVGRRRMFVLGLCIYAVSSLAGALATGPGLLVAARAVQGIGGAVLFPTTLALVTTTFAKGAQRNRALAVWGAAGGSGMVLGSLLGGMLTQAFGWQAVFYVNIPLAVIAIALAFPLLAADAMPRTGHRFDLPGTLTATVGTTLIVFALVEGPDTGWRSPAVVVTATVGVLLLAAFIRIEARTREPLMPPHLFRNRNLGTGVGITMLFMATLGTLLYFLTIYFQNVHGYSALQTGIAFILPMVAVVTGSYLAGRMSTRFGTPATLTTSLALAASGTAVLGLTMSEPATYSTVLPGLIILSLGQGAAYTTMFAAATTGVPAEQQGIASGIASTGQQVGGAIGLAILVAIANSGTEGSTGQALRTATTSGLRTAVFVIVAGIAAAALLAATFRLRGSSARLSVPGERGAAPA